MGCRRARRWGEGGEAAAVEGLGGAGWCGTGVARHSGAPLNPFSFFPFWSLATSSNGGKRRWWVVRDMDRRPWKVGGWSGPRQWGEGGGRGAGGRRARPSASDVIPRRHGRVDGRPPHSRFQSCAHTEKICILAENVATTCCKNIFWGEPPPRWERSCVHFWLPPLRALAAPPPI